MSPFVYSLCIVGIASLTTIVTRALPFVLFRRRALPPFIRYLGTILPASIIIILIVYCLRNSFTAPFGESLCALLSLGAVMVLHRLRHNMLLSIGGATLLYMLLIRLVPLI